MAEPAHGAFLEARTITEILGDEDILEERLSDDPADPFARAQLEEIFRSESRWEELVELLLDRAAAADTEDEAQSLLDQVAVVYEDRLDDLTAALEVRASAFARSPSRADVADALWRLASERGAWDRVLRAFSERAPSLEDTHPVAAAEIWFRIGRIHLEHASDIDAAEAAFERAVGLRAETAAPAADLLRRVAQDTEAPASQARLHRTAARLLREANGDNSSVEWHYLEAIRLMPRDRATVEELARLYEERGELLKAVRLLERSQEWLPNEKDRADLRLRAAAIYARDLGEKTRAVDLFAAALELDPDHLEATRQVAERHFEKGRFAQAEPLFQRVVRRIADVDPLDQADVLGRAGRTALELGDARAALARFDQALQRDPENATFLAGRGDALAALHRWDDAYAAYQKALVEKRKDGDGQVVADLMFRMGEARRGDGRTDDALRHYQAALERDPSHPRALESAIELFSTAGRYDRVIHLKRRQLDGAGAATRVRLLCDIAGLTSRHLGDVDGAVSLYREALRHAPRNPHVLHPLVEHLSAAGRWAEAIDTILELVEQEQSPLRRGKYYQAAGVLARRRLAAVEDALAYFEKALDCFFREAPSVPEGLRPGCLKAFSDLVAMLDEHGEHKEMERAYRRMLKRLPADDPEAPRLWHELGEVYRNHLGHAASAMSAFEVASALDADRLTRHRILIDLYESAGPDELDKAVERRRRLLAVEPFEVEHYRALRKLCERMDDSDGAWCMARALVILGQANAEERALYHRRHSSGVIRQPLCEDDWRLVTAPELSRSVSAVLALACQGAAGRRAFTARALGLVADPAYRAETARLEGVVRCFARLLGVAPPPVYVLPDRPGPVVVANVRETGPALVAGRDLLGKTTADIVFSAAEALTLLRPALYLRAALPTHDDRRAAFLAAASLVRDDVPVPVELARETDRFRRAIGRTLLPDQLEALTRILRTFVEKGEPIDLTRWESAVDATCLRTALSLTGDLEAALRAARARPAGLAAEDRITDLLLYSVSPEHLELRRRLSR